tara:strand:- start:1590 stop:5567 length:3978 start_codon:yes stop_codon:yes gene_type:complete
MVQISEDIGINNVPVSFDLTLKEVKKIKPLTSTLKPVYKERVEGKLVPITDEKELANIKNKPSDYNIVLDKSFEGVSDGVKGFFLDFLVSTTFIQNKTNTPKTISSEKRYFQYLNIDEGDIEKEYPNNADEMLKELEDCIKEVVKIIGKCDIIAVLKLLEDNDFLSKPQNATILSKNLTERLKGLKITDLSSEKINQAVDEDYTKTGKRQEYKKNHQERELEKLTQQYEASQETENPMTEKDYNKKTKRIKNIGSRIDNKILNAADKSNPIFNPKKLMKHIKVTSNDTEFSITVDTYEYMKELMIDANMGEVGTDSFVYTSSGKKEDRDFEESVKEFKNFNKNNGEIYDWLGNIVSGQSLSDTTKALEEIDFSKDMIEDVIGLMQNSNAYIKEKELDVDNIKQIINKIKEIYREKEGGDSEYSETVEGEYGVEEDSTDDGVELDSEGLLAYKNPEDDEEEKMDFSKQLLKSVLETITIIKKEERVGKIVESKSTPAGSLLLIERMFRIKKEKNILEAAINARPEKEKREILFETMRKVLGTNELGNIILPAISVEIKDRMVAQHMLAEKDERLITHVGEWMAKSGNEYGGYTLYSIMSNKKNTNLSLNNVIKELKKEVEDLADEEKVKLRIQKILLDEVKPIKGLADIRGDILLRLTPVNKKLEVGRMKLNYKYFISKKDIEEHDVADDTGSFDTDKKNILDDKLKEGLEKYLETYEDMESQSESKAKKKAIGQIDRILVGTQNLKDSLESAFDNTQFFEYTKGKATPLKEEINDEDLDDFVLGFFYGTGSNKSQDIKTLLSAINRNLTFLDRKIESIEKEKGINITELVNTNKLNEPKLIEAIEIYIEEIKSLGLPEKYFKEKTVSTEDILQLEKDKETGKYVKDKETGEYVTLRYKDSPRTVESLRGKERYAGGGETIIRPDDYYAYYQYYKVRNEPFIKWFEGLRPLQIKKLIVGGETPIHFDEDETKIIEILVNLRKDAEKYFTDNKEYFDEKDDSFIKDILKTIEEAYIENKELDPDDIDDGSTDEFKNPEQQMDMENAQDRYGNTSLDAYTENNFKYRITDKQKQKYKGRGLSDKEIWLEEMKLKYPAMDSDPELRQRMMDAFPKKEIDESNLALKMLLKADIESGYEDDVFYWMFFWMSDSVRENVKTSFQDYSQLKFTFDDSKNIRLIDLLDPDFTTNLSGSLPKEKDGRYDIDGIKAAYSVMFLKEIYNKKINQKGFREVLEDVSFIPVLKENKTSFDSMDKIDFEPAGQTNKFRSSDKRPPKMVAKPTGRKRKVNGKMVEVMDYVPERLNQQEREIITNLILPARSRYSRAVGRV